MQFNPLVIVFALPSLITLVVLRLRRRSWSEIASLLGWRTSPAIYFLWSLLLVLVITLPTIFLLFLLAPDLLRHPGPGTTEFYYAHLVPNLFTIALAFFNEALFTASGEEIFFRGWLEGLLVKRWGFAIGNLLQAIFFLLPHLLLLFVSLRLWPLLVIQLLAGWLLGWLRYTSGSIFPGWLSHAVTNTISDVIAMRWN